VVKLRNSSSIQLRAAWGSTAATKLPGARIWQAEYAKAKPQASSVKVAPAANSSSVVARVSAIM